MPTVVIYSKAFFSALGLFILALFLYNLIFRYLLRYRSEIAPIIDKRLRIPIYILILVGSLIIFLKFLPGNFEKSAYEYYLEFFKFISLAVVGVEIFSFFIFDYIWIKKKTVGVPTIFRDIIKFILYTTLIIFILSYFNINIAPFLTTAGILTMVIGLALQDTLGNVFAGLTMQFSSPYKTGDILEVGEIKGRVEKIDWRSTYIFTRSNDYIIVPHSIMSKLEVKNYHQPTKITLRVIRIGLSHDIPPTRIKTMIIDLLKDMEGISKEYESSVKFQSFNDFSITYEIEFPIEMKSFDYCEHMENEVMDSLWYRLKKEGIEIPYPTHIIRHHDHKVCDIIPVVLPILKKVDFLNALPDKKLNYLALNTKIQYFIKGETICNYGDKGDSFYIIKSGEVDVYIPIDGQETRIASLKANDFFGEISLFTGEERTATIKTSKNSEMLVLTKSDFVDMIKEEPEVAKTISRIIAYRQSRSEVEQSKAETARLKQEQEEEKNLQRETLSTQLFNKIKNFFSI